MSHASTTPMPASSSDDSSPNVAYEMETFRIDKTAIAVHLDADAGTPPSAPAPSYASLSSSCSTSEIALCGATQTETSSVFQAASALPACPAKSSAPREPSRPASWRAGCPPPEVADGSALVARPLLSETDADAGAMPAAVGLRGVLEGDESGNAGADVVDESLLPETAARIRRMAQYLRREKLRLSCGSAALTLVT